MTGKIIISCLAVPFLISACRSAGGPVRPSPASAPAVEWDGADYELVLKKYVEKGLVKYRRLKENSQLLDRFVLSLARVDPIRDQRIGGTTPRELAFWINAHNAVALRAAVQAYPAKSVQKPWMNFSDTVKATIAGREMTLAEIADRARQVGNFDPRIELTLFLPARGGGELTADLFRPHAIDAQLDDAVKRALSDPTRVKIDHDRQTLWLGNAIYRVRQKHIDRYHQAYRTQNATILNALAADADANQRRRLNTAVGYRVRELPFDWTLNEREDPPCSLDNWTPSNSP